MRISYNWLKDYVDVKSPPEKLAELLTMSGFSVESIEKTPDDHIFEVEVTSNRPDCLSVVGIAREVAAITGRKLKIPPLDRHYEAAKRPKQRQIIVKIEDKKLCPRYTARIIRNVKVGESPKWLKTKIEAMKLKPVNNIVDITNFCLFETGEPMHAFDLDKISGKEIYIRRAKKGEGITTIDGVNRILESSDLVIADKDRPIAIAGIMGGKSSEVSGSTKNILLEAAYFDPVSVRRTSRRLGISTESSYRFERRVDLENIPYSSARAEALINDMAGGGAGEFQDVGEKKAGVRFVYLNYSKLNKILGVDIAPAKARAILGSLGIKAAPVSKDRIKLRIPHFRYDLQNEIDIVEEAARIYGYERIPETLPDITASHARIPFNMIVDNRIRAVLTSLGLDEIITYSLSGKKVLESAGLSEKEAIEIKNPLSNDQDILRPSLIIGMLNSIRWNINRKTKDLKLFELGNAYLKESAGGFIEKKYLCIGMTGEAHSDWAGGSRRLNFFDLKGALEALFVELGIGSFSFKDSGDGRFSKAASSAIELGGEPIGVFGEVAGKILGEFDIKDTVYACEICIDPLLKYASLKKAFKELPRYPSAARDLSIIVGKDIKNFEITASIKDAAGSILKGARLIDRYIGKQIPDGKVGLTYRLEYQDLKKTLEEKDVSEAHSRILQALEKNIGAKLR